MVAVAAVLLGTLLWPAAAAGADESSDPAVVSAYADVLVTTTSNDLDLPLRSVPAAIVGVLGTHVESIKRLAAYIDAQRQAAVAAWIQATTTARQAPVGARASRPAGSGCSGNFACFKDCTLQIESHGNYGAVSPGGKYRGAWQFDQSTWNGAVARAGYPEWSGQDPAQAPSGVQDAAANQLYLERGNQPWGGRC